MSNQTRTTITPFLMFSFFVNCSGEDELDRWFEAFSDGGKALMPPDNYGFSQEFA